MANVPNIVQPQAAEILKVTKETRQEWTFRVAYPTQVKPGQFMQLSIPTIGECPISVSGQGEGYLDFTLRSVGKVTNVLFTKEAGDVLFIRGPYGRGWPIDQIRGRHLVAIAGGTGLSPLRALLNMALADPTLFKDVHLITGFKNHEGILFNPDLEAWRAAPHFHTTYCLDTESFGVWRQGFVTAYVKDVPFKDFGDDYAVLVVGPPPMMKFTGMELMKNGVTEDHLWMSFERKMSCAVGKCGNCRIDETYVCLDGPVFPYTRAKYLVD